MSASTSARVSVLALVAVLTLGIGIASALVTQCAVPDDPVSVPFPDDPASLADVPHVSLFDRPDPFLSALREHIGSPLNVRRVAIYEESAFAEVQDPDVPSHLDEYDFRDGALDPVSSPVAAGRYETWDREVFPLEQIHARVVREVVAAARAEFDELEHPVVSHVVISRTWDSDSYEDNPHHQDTGPVEISVYVNDPVRGGSGYLSADTQGNVLDINRS